MFLKHPTVFVLLLYIIGLNGGSSGRIVVCTAVMSTGPSQILGPIVVGNVQTRGTKQ